VSAFQPNELEFLTGERRLAWIATVGRDGTLHVVPVGWSYNRETDTIDIGGHDSRAPRSTATWLARVVLRS
jgi:pyridoxamine 5'-phosphate oxidase family protein